MPKPEPINEDDLRGLLNRGLPDEDPYAQERIDQVLRRCREQLHGRDTVTLLCARLWVALATLLARLLYLSRGHSGGRVNAYLAAAPHG